MPGEHLANAPLHIPAVTSMSPTLSPLRLASAWLYSILSPSPLSLRRPRLEVLNASQNRIQHVAGLSLLPSLVVLNLGECSCPHKHASGSDESVMRSLANADLSPRLHTTSSLWKTPLPFHPRVGIMLFSHVSLGPTPPFY